jgi:pyridoxal/pyridoxine/pyridoxamine kinase
MNETQKSLLRVSLTQTLNEWFESDEVSNVTDVCSGYLGDEISRTMAEAAIAVLEANYRIQDYLRDNDLINDM